MTIKFRVGGMSCAACSARVEKVTKEVPGVFSAEVNLLSGSLTVDADSEAVTQLIIQAINDAGYSAETENTKRVAEKTENTGESKIIRTRIVVSAFFLAVLMYFTMGHMIGLPLPEWYMGTENALVAALLQFMLTLPLVSLNRSYYQKG